MAWWVTPAPWGAVAHQGSQGASAAVGTLGMGRARGCAGSWHRAGHRGGRYQEQQKERSAEPASGPVAQGLPGTGSAATPPAAHVPAPDAVLALRRG